jgi:hypothetical protein
MLVSAVTPFNATLFPEYVLPNVAHLIRDAEELVRCMYAQCIVPLADTALRYLEMGQALRAHGAFQRPSDAQEIDEARYEACILSLEPRKANLTHDPRSRTSLRSSICRIRFRTISPPFSWILRVRSSGQYCTTYHRCASSLGSRAPTTFY